MPATSRALRAASVASAIALVLAALGAGALATGSSACSSSAKLVGAGGACELASDCEEGLVCIPQLGSSTGRICSSDLTSIQMTEFPDAGPDATVADADDDGAIATYPTPDGTAPPTDASTSPTDSGGHPADSGGD